MSHADNQNYVSKGLVLHAKSASIVGHIFKSESHYINIIPFFANKLESKKKKKKVQQSNSAN